MHMVISSTLVEPVVNPSWWACVCEFLGVCIRKQSPAHDSAQGTQRAMHRTRRGFVSIRFEFTHGSIPCEGPFVSPVPSRMASVLGSVSAPT